MASKSKTNANGQPGNDVSNHNGNDNGNVNNNGYNCNDTSMNMDNLYGEGIFFVNRDTTDSWLGHGEEKVATPLLPREENGPCDGSEDVTLPPVLCQLTGRSANNTAPCATGVDEQPCDNISASIDSSIRARPSLVLTPTGAVPVTTDAPPAVVGTGTRPSQASIPSNLSHNKNLALFNTYRNQTNYRGNSSSQNTGYAGVFNPPGPTPSVDVPAHTDEPPAAVGSGNRTAQASTDLDQMSDTNTVVSFATSNSVPKQQKLAIQWNLRGMTSKEEELQLMVDQAPPYIIALQETYSAAGDKWENYLRGQYRWHHRSASAGLRRCRGVSIGIRSDLDQQILSLPDLPNVYVVAVKVGAPLNLTAVSLYLPPAKQIDMEELDRFIENLPKPLLVMGDFNARHTVWGSSTNDNRGKQIVNIIAKNELVLLNDGRPTRVGLNCADSVLDLTLATVSLASRISWRVDTDTRGSDHFPIHIESHIAQPSFSNCPRWRFADADWPKFERCIFDAIHKNNTEFDIHTFSEAIISAAMISIPRSRGGPPHRRVPWWNTEVAAKIKLRRRLLRRLQKFSPNHPLREELVEAFKTARREAKQAIAVAKANSWKEFIESVNPTAPIGELWFRVNAMRGKYRRPPMSLKINGERIVDPEKIAEELAEQYFQASSDQAKDARFKAKKAVAESSPINFGSDQSLVYNRPFSVNELMWAIDRCKGNSVGSDSIGYPMIKHLPYSVKLELLSIINRLWENGSVPEKWREGIVIPLPKAGEDRSATSSYRPITLLSCVSKVMERMVNRRLVTELEERGLQSEHQHGFRRGKGCSTHLAEIDRILAEAEAANQHTEILKLDLSKAFDTAWRYQILSRLYSYGIRGNLGNYIQAFLKDRTQYVAVGGASSTCRATVNGVPQGSVLSPTLFTILVDTLFDIPLVGAEIVVYADDIIILVRCKTLKALRRKMQATLKKIHRWTSEIGLTLSIRKCALTHICSRMSPRHLSGLRPLQIEQQQVPYCTTTRILGVTLDQRLTFRKHWEETRRDVNQRLNLMKVLNGSAKAGRRTAINVGKAIVLPKIFHGIELTSRSDLMEANKLAPAYHTILREGSGAFRTSPIRSILVESDELPFHYVSLQHALRVGIRLTSTMPPGQESKLLIRARLWLRESTGNDLPEIARIHWIGEIPWHSKKPSICWEVRDRIQAGIRSKTAKHIHSEILNQRFRQHEVIYTDGSAANGKVGAGATGPAGETRLALPNSCTVFSAEAMAMIAGIQESSRGRKKVIFTDSASVLQALERGNSKHPWVQELHTLSLANKVDFCWIPGHCNILGNEAADRLADR